MSLNECKELEEEEEQDEEPSKCAMEKCKKQLNGHYEKQDEYDEDKGKAFISDVACEENEEFLREKGVKEKDDLRIMPFSEKASFLEWLNADYYSEVKKVNSSQEFAKFEVKFH